MEPLKITQAFLLRSRRPITVPNASQIMPATMLTTKMPSAIDLDYIREGHRHGRLRNVMSLSFGFGGANAALVFGYHNE